MQNSPWYAVVVGAVGACGVILGQLINMLSNWLTRSRDQERERQRLEHERTLHWSETRLALYLEIVAAVEAHAEYVRKITEAFESGSKAASLESWNKLAASRDTFRLLRQRAQILASSPVRAAVDSYYAASEGLATKRKRAETQDGVKVNYNGDSISKLISGREAVESAIRIELGTDSEHP